MQELGYNLCSSLFSLGSLLRRFPIWSRGNYDKVLSRGFWYLFLRKGMGVFSSPCVLNAWVKGGHFKDICDASDLQNGAYKLIPQKEMGGCHKRKNKKVKE
ncbi:hypothetical protein POVCU2_0010100 [Plasmodium ovale curtisi]|uniref:Uncharacterized protein n=1 Tax=Plasmodium ovale curtisi TaxID=864141 RepID=A0A1A8VVV4_PLAOA|nr:hypothetical protein POVCU2_0010100 [Plasmodium ovale curtisi]SBS83822.1 hypothetical protein POVCU1_009350 [Plasmodium ovale curtisi]